MCDVGVDYRASERSSRAVVDIARVEAEFRRKSELIQTKTAVLNDKERELRRLEQQLVSRERAISWQEHHLDVKNSSQHPAVQSSSESGGGYWQQVENVDGQAVEKYRGQVSPQELHSPRRYAQAGFEHRQHLLPPAGDVPVSCTGWAMEKLEEQFARLAQSGTNDVLARQSEIGRTQLYVQESAEMQPGPKMIPFHPADRRSGTDVHQGGPKHEFSSVIRKRGRPKGSRNRYTYKIRPALAVGGLPVRGQLIHHLYTRSQMLQSKPIMASAAKEAVRQSMAQQMIVNHSPPANAGMMADSCQNMMKMFASGRLVPGEQLKVSYGGPWLSAHAPVLLTQGQVQSAAAPGMMPTRVQQLLASAAFTTGASILPPLSPVLIPEHVTSVTDDAGHTHILQDSFQRGRNVGDHDARSDVAYRVVEGSVVATDHAGGSHDAEPEQAVFVNRSKSEVPQQQVSTSLMSPGCDDSDHDPMTVQSRRSRSHILPKVSPSDTGDRCWSSAQLHREKEQSNYLSTTLCDSGIDDDDDKRLVVVIDGD